MLDSAGITDGTGLRDHTCFKGHREGGLVLASVVNIVAGTEGPVPQLRDRVVAPRGADPLMLTPFVLS